MTAYQDTVQYYETDQMQISHHSNYIRWMEEARVAFLACIGFPYEKIEASGLISPVVSDKCDYKAPTTFADVISITVTVKQFSGVRLALGYRMTLPDHTVVCLAESSHCFTTKAGNIVNLKKTNPDFYQALVANLKAD